MNILFVLYHGMTCNSAHHVASLAKGLTERHGDRCVVAVPDEHAEGRGEGESATSAGRGLLVVPFRRLSEIKGLFPGGEHPDVVVAWTPRENVRKTVERYRRLHRVPLVIHLEDNEDAITARYLGVPVEGLCKVSCWRWWTVRRLALSHPRRMRSFLAEAQGVSAVMDRLVEFVPAGVPSCVFWPGYDEALFGTSDILGKADPRAELRRLGVPDDATAIVYTGNIHHGNAEDMVTLYDTVAALNHRGMPARLVRTGETHAAGFSERVVSAQPCVIELGFRPRSELPGLLAGADVLVQPGEPGAFNDYRFPSKLPEFLVSGHPVVMARTNVGRELVDGSNALIVPNGTVGEFVEAIERLRRDTGTARTIGEGGRAFARAHLRWQTAVESFRRLLEKVLTVPTIGSI